MKKILHLSIRLKLIIYTLCILLFTYSVGYFVLNSTPLNKQLAPVTLNKHTHHIEHNIPTAITNQHNMYEVGAYVINLPQSTQRYAYIKHYANNLNFPLVRIAAIDGASLAIAEIKQKVDLQAYQIFLRHYPNYGTIGCYLSHIKAWQKFLNSKFKFALILEDDVSFEPDKLQMVINDLINNSELWDIVNFETAHHGLPLTIKNISNKYNLVVYLTEVTHSGAYLINRTAAQALLAKALPIKMPIDHYFTRAWEFGIKFTGIENPRLVLQTFGKSDIGKTQRLSNVALTTMDLFTHCLYKVKSYVIRFCYNLKLYFNMRKLTKHLNYN